MNFTKIGFSIYFALDILQKYARYHKQIMTKHIHAVPYSLQFLFIRFEGCAI